MTKCLWCVSAALVLASCSQPVPPPFPGGELVDLSHSYDATTIFWPTAEEGFKLEKVADGVTPAGYYYASNNFCAAEHGGTHLDAPIHFAQGHPAVDQIPISRFFAPAFVIDVSAAVAKNADYLVTTSDFEQFEKDHGRIPADAIVLLRTGFSKLWPDAARYLGTAERGDQAASKLHFPGLHPDAAKWIVANRPIKAIGIDTASIDFGQSTLFESHRALYGHDIPAFENLTNLDRLPPTGAHIIALPMKIGGGSGAPLRAVAILPK